jgi:peptide/nickel transport system ATP-binding protein
MSDIYRFENVQKYYLAKKRGIIETIFREKPIYVRALDGISLSLSEGKITALVGESGSGKTTVGKIMATLEVQTSGSVFFRNKKISKEDFSTIRKSISMVFQNPSTSLNPRMKVYGIISEALNEQNEVKINEALTSVGLNYNEIKDKQVRELSGGQIQRIAIARSLAKRPDLIILDEPTSALDESIQAQILNILADLYASYHLTYLFITHNIEVAKYLSDEIIVLYAGKIVETGKAEDVIQEPQHPYTQVLMKSVPSITSKTLVAPSGDVPSLINPPKGCRFHSRCPFVMEKCKQEEPVLFPNKTGSVACWLYE